MSNYNKWGGFLMQNYWRVIFLPILVISLSGWFWSEKKKEEPVVTGIWKSVKAQSPVVLNFDSNGSFKADLENNGQSDITGEYRVLGDQLILSDDRTTSDTYCRDKAYYYFNVSQNHLRLALIADSCAPRRGILPGQWELVPAANDDKRKTKQK